MEEIPYPFISAPGELTTRGNIMALRYKAFVGSAAVAAALLGFVAGDSFAVTLTVESRCPGSGTYVEGGTGWGNTTSKSNQTGCSIGARSSKDAGAYADFIPAITTEGTYNVYLTWGVQTMSNNGPNAENITVAVTDNTGTTSQYVSQRANAGCSPNNANTLVSIGQFYFKPGLGHKVRLANTATGQCNNGASRRYMTADAVVFDLLSAAVPAAPASWSSIKARFTN